MFIGTNPHGRGKVNEICDSSRLAGEKRAFLSKSSGRIFQYKKHGGSEAGAIIEANVFNISSSGKRWQGDLKKAGLCPISITSLREGYRCRPAGQLCFGFRCVHEHHPRITGWALGCGLVDTAKGQFVGIAKGGTIRCLGLMWF